MANATDKQGGPFIYAEGQNDAGQPDDTVSVSAHFVSRAESVIEDLIHNAELQHRATCWHKGMNADLLDSKHAAYLTTAVNEDDVDHPDLNDSSPAAPSGGLNVKWQVATAQNTDSQTPVSAYVPFSSISTVTAVSTDYVVITDTSDSANPKRALVSDIITAAAAAPLDAQYVTLATNATLTNERVLTAGTGLDLADAGAGSTITIDLDLNELTTAAAAALDHFVFVDADDNGTKKTSGADLKTALGITGNEVTAASAFAADRLLASGGANRTAVDTGIAFDSAGNNLSNIGTIASGAHTITGALTISGAISSIVLDILTADESDDTGTLINSGLNVTLEAGGYYQFEAWLPVLVEVGGKLDLDGGTATMTAIAYDAKVVTTTGTAGENVLAVKNTALATDVTIASTADVVTLRGYCQVNAGGTFILRFASDANPNGMYLQKGAWIRCMRVG